MSRWIFIDVEPEGVLAVKGDGSIYLRTSREDWAASVSGEEWDVDFIIGMEVGQVDRHRTSKWEIRRENTTEIVFEMIEADSAVNWGVPLKVTVKRQDLVDGVKKLLLE